MTLILDYDAGNLGSVKRACTEVGLAAEFSADPAAVAQAERIIFPGVGAAGSAMRSLAERGLDVALKQAIAKGTPVLGICLGMQVSLDYSEENDTKTLGLIAGRVQRFQLDHPDLKIPHMGWNEVRVRQSHPVLAPALPKYRQLFLYPAQRLRWQQALQPASQQQLQPRSFRALRVAAFLYRYQHTT